MPTRTERLLNEFADSIARKYTQRYGQKLFLSAAVVAFDKLTADQREKIFDIASGVTLEDISQKAAENMRFAITTWQALDENESAIARQSLSPDENRAVTLLLNALNPAIQAARRQQIDDIVEGLKGGSEGRQHRRQTRPGRAATG